MAYTSGRTVKSPVKKTNPVTDATRTARALVRRHLTPGPTVTIDSSRCFATDAAMTERVRTVITFPEGTDAAKLAAAITELPRYHSMAWNSCSISYLTDLEG